MKLFRQSTSRSCFIAIIAFLLVSTHNLTAQQPQPVPVPNIAPWMPTVVLGAPAGSAASDATLPVRLQHALDSTFNAIDTRFNHGVSVSVIVPGMAQWSGVAGYSHSSVAIQPEMLFEIASITKTFTAATIFQLHDEGKLSINDSIWKYFDWLEGFPNIDSTITIRQLLGHTSGIFDYLNDDTTGAAVNDFYFYNPTRAWMPEELLVEFVKAPIFKAGTNTKYSNTNYILLGMIIEQVTGAPVTDEFRQRFLIPLNLNNTLMAWEQNVSGRLAHGWMGFTLEPTQNDLSSIPTRAIFTGTWAAGGIVSTATDVARWTDALYGGSLLSDSSMNAMLTFKLVPNVGFFGLGAFQYFYGNKVMYGHDGRLFGFRSFTFSIPEDSITMTVLINSDHNAFDVGTNTILLSLLDEIYRPVVSSVARSHQAHTQLSATIFPNPFTDATAMRYTLPSNGPVHITVYDALGRSVSTPIHVFQEAGEHSVVIDLKGQSSGMYHYRLQTAEGTVMGVVQQVR